MEVVGRRDVVGVESVASMSEEGVNSRSLREQEFALRVQHDGMKDTRALSGAKRWIERCGLSDSMAGSLWFLLRLV